MSRHVIIIGVGPGIGLSLIKKFGREGFTVSMMSRNKGRLAEYKYMLKEEGMVADFFQTDAANAQSMAQNVLNAIGQHGTPDVLIYHAAALHGGKLLEHSIVEFENDHRVNVLGAIQAAQVVVPYMEQKGNGTILLTGGGLAHQPQYTYASLSLGKGGIHLLGTMLHQEIQPKGLRSASVTINGFVKEGTPFDPDKIADRYWSLYQQPGGAEWKTEVPFNGG